MPTINIAGFSGIAPRLGATLLSSKQAQLALNAKIQSGELRAWRKPVLAYTPVQSNIQTVYQLSGPANATQWLEWATDVNVCSSPVADLSDYRIYYTGSGTPKKTNWALATAGTGAKPYTSYEMGLPAPVSAPVLAATGGTAPTESRAYLYTYVSLFGSVREESAPSLPTLVTCNAAGSTVTVSGFAAAPAGAYNFTHIRIYRSVTGATTSSYLQVAEIAIGTASYADTTTVVNLGAALYTQYFTPPPATLSGIVSLPNGVLAGFVSNQVWFCEPGYPHAWPSKYSLSVEFPIVGLGVFNNTLVVCTTKNPFLMTGTNPAAMTQEKMPITQPCVSKRSIVYDQSGVMYASPDGLVAIGTTVQDVITTQLITRDDWQLMYPTTMIGVLYNRRYIGMYNNAGVYTGICFARDDAPSLTTFDFPAKGIFTQTITGNVYAINAVTNKVMQLDADTYNNSAYAWRSKVYVMPAPVSFAALKVAVDFVYAGDTAAYLAAKAVFDVANLAVFNSTVTSLGGCFGDAQFNSVLIAGSNLSSGFGKIQDFRAATVTVFADGVQILSTGINSPEPIRMPSGFKAYEWEVQFTGNVPVRGFVMSTSIGELKIASAGYAAQRSTMVSD